MDTADRLACLFLALVAVAIVLMVYFAGQSPECCGEKMTRVSSGIREDGSYWESHKCWKCGRIVRYTD